MSSCFPSVFPLLSSIFHLPTSIFFLSAIISSISTGGSRSLVLSRDSTDTTPRIVGNHKRPSRPFHPAGLETPLHWTLTNPSDFPKTVLVRAFVVPRTKLSSSFLLTRKIPFRQLIQK